MQIKLCKLKKNRIKYRQKIKKIKIGKIPGIGSAEVASSSKTL